MGRKSTKRIETDFEEYPDGDVPEVQVYEDVQGYDAGGPIEPDGIYDHGMFDDGSQAAEDEARSVFAMDASYDPGQGGVDAEDEDVSVDPEVFYSEPKDSDRKLAEVLLSDLILDERLQPRSTMTQALVDEYMEDIADGDTFPPVEVIDVDGRFYLVDGWHRVAAYRALGHTTVFAKISEGGLEQAILISSGANADHGLRRTNADKRRAVVRLLTTPSFASMSDGAIARASKVSVRFVGMIRKTLQEDGSIPEVTDRVGVDGRVRDASAFQEQINSAPKLEQPKDPFKDERSEFDNPDDPNAYVANTNDKPPAEATKVDEDDDEFISLEESEAIAAFDAVSKLLRFTECDTLLTVKMAKIHRHEQFVLIKDRVNEVANWVDGFADALKDVAGKG